MNVELISAVAQVAVPIVLGVGMQSIRSWMVAHNKKTTMLDAASRAAGAAMLYAQQNNLKPFQNSHDLRAVVSVGTEYLAEKFADTIHEQKVSPATLNDIVTGELGKLTTVTLGTTEQVVSPPPFVVAAPEPAK